MKKKKTDPNIRCKFCNRPRTVSARSHAENPFCNQCYDARCALSTLEDGMVALWEHEGDYLIFAGERPLTAEEREELHATIRAERAARPRRVPTPKT